MTVDKKLSEELRKAHTRINKLCPDEGLDTKLAFITGYIKYDFPETSKALISILEASQ